MDIRVLAVLPGNMAVVSTEGLVRVVKEGTSEIIAELLNAPTAARLIDFMADPEWGELAVAVPY